MIKRANKITALLLSAAAVISLVPATGVNAADVKRIESQDGTLNGAVAYKDGKFLIDGELEDKDEAVYYLNNGKYTELEDVDPDSDYALYGEKYVSVDDDSYYVDLSSGKGTDDELADDNADDATTALRKKIKKDNDDRFTDAEATDKTLSPIENKFGETWYATTYTAESTTPVSVYTDVKGNYIDADYNVGKIKVKTTDSAATANKSITLDNTDDTEKFGTGNAWVEVSGATILGQDKDYIYRKVTITINSTDNNISEVNGQTKLNGIGGKTVTYDAIQKISKAQASDDHKGIKYAKTVNTYAITKEEGDSYTGDIDSLLSNSDTQYTVVNGKLIARRVYKDSNNDYKIDAAAITLTKSNSYADVSDGVFEEDVESANAVDVDVDGNVWKIDSGNLYKFNNDDDWDKVYKVDGAMTDLSIYDKNNFVVWNNDDEVYSIVGGKKSSNDDNNDEVKTGWVQDSNGAWSFVKADGTKATGWLDNNGTWFYLDTAGNMQTGWVNVNGNWFYLNPISDGTRGAMQTGWVNVNGTWFYLNPISDGTRGAMKTGWQYINGSWYYLNPISDGTRGAMKTGWLNDNGTWYYLQSNGAMATNTTINGYKLGSNGAWIR